MRLDDTDVIDFLGFEKSSNDIVVTILDDHDWTNEQRHLQLLQAKVNRCFDFIESGELYDALRRSTGTEPVRAAAKKISIIAKHYPSPDGLGLLKEASRVATELGLSLEHSVREEDRT